MFDGQLINSGHVMAAPSNAASLRLSDAHGRRFEYLRLSLTDVCNFQCSYCLPNGYRKAKGAPAYLSIDEIIRLVRAFATLGLWKVRLTGGEPTLRPEFEEVAAAVASVSGIRRVAVTTNGYRLPERAQGFHDAGIRAINISIDSLDPHRFLEITGHDRLAEVLQGVDACQAAGFDSVKINTVLLKGLNDRELDKFVGFVATRDLALRFIEVMRTNDNPGYFGRHHLPGATVIAQLEARGWRASRRQAGDGPAIEYTHRQSKGRIGIIAPYSTDFCASCNRLRVSASGKLHLCLFGDGGFDLRPFLQSDSEQGALVERIMALMGRKDRAHDLHNDNSGATPNLASIGG